MSKRTKPQPKPRSSKPTGRPSSYTEEVADIICERIVGGESLRAICSDKAMPPASTVFRWLAAHDDFRERYTRAQEARAEAFADEIVSIADGSGDHNRDRLRVDARKWVAARLLPMRYGDRIANRGDDKPEQPQTEQAEAPSASSPMSGAVIDFRRALNGGKALNGKANGHG